MLRLFFVLISLIATNSSATELENLYQSHIAVTSQSSEERDQLMPTVLRQVLLKVVGDRSVLKKADLTALLAQSSSLMQQYQYHRLYDISDDLTEPDRLAMLLAFKEAELNSALAELHLPIWSKSRPDILVWIALDDGQNRQVLSAESLDTTIPDNIIGTADTRGITVLLPLMDLQDQSQVRFTDIWGDFTSTIQQASQRYGVVIPVMAKASLNSNNSTIDWHAIINDDSEQWQTKGTIDIAVQEGIEELADRLSRRFSQVLTDNQSGQTLALQISNVRDYGDYTRVMDYLSQLQSVNDVKMASLNNGLLDVTMSLQGDVSVFNQTLAIERVLAEENGYSSPDVIRYRLLP